MIGHSDLQELQRYLAQTTEDIAQAKGFHESIVSFWSAGKGKAVQKRQGHF